MVFESIVVDLLNKYVGQYVKNLDPSQLHIGIWRGNVILKDLELKDTSLDEVDLPIQVVSGCVGRLTLQIPWKNLYTEATYVKVEDVRVLVKPNADIKYDEVKEETRRWEKKKRKLKKIEDARFNTRTSDNKEENGEQESSSFGEKLGVAIVRNLQISIQNVHIRYEDTVSCPTSPFSIGITLQNLSAETTDENFKVQIVRDKGSVINKVVRLDELAIYCNPHESLGSMSCKKWMDTSSSELSQDHNMKYTMMKPLIAHKEMTINTQPDTSIPKLLMSLVLEEVGFVFMRSQYMCLMNMIASFERMQKQQPYRKYRPVVGVHGNALLWWKYCVCCLVEVDIRRRRRMWRWDNISSHRTSCKMYQHLYGEKLQQKNPSKDLLRRLEAMEKKLNVVSITIFRQLAENQVQRLKEEKKNRKMMKKKNKKMWSVKKLLQKTKERSSEIQVKKKLEELLPSSTEREEEMNKLYKSIGYTENEVTQPLPLDYVAVVFKFQLNKVSLKLVEDDAGEPAEILTFTLDRIISHISQRPSSQGLDVWLKVGRLVLNGTPQEKGTPALMKSPLEYEKSQTLVNVLFEMNPLEREVDQSIKVSAQPLQLVYDERSIASIIKFFQPPEDRVLWKLRKKAYSTFENMKTGGTSGLLRALDLRNVVDIDVRVKASYLIIPGNGSYRTEGEVLVVDFGSFALKSDEMKKSSHRNSIVLSDLEKIAYDQFDIELTSLQVLLCTNEEDFKSQRTKEDTHCHLLRPVGFYGKISKAIVPKDRRLKQISFSGELPSLELLLSDAKVERLVKLFDGLSMPGLAEGSNHTEYTATKDFDDIPEYTELDIDLSLLHNETISTTEEADSNCSGEENLSDIAQQVKLELNFNLKKMGVFIVAHNEKMLGSTDCIYLCVKGVNCCAQLRRWDMSCRTVMDYFEVTNKHREESTRMVHTETGSPGLTLSYSKRALNKSLTLGKSYIFSREEQIKGLQFGRGGVEEVDKEVDVDVAMVWVTLHQEVLLNMLATVFHLLKPFIQTEGVQQQNETEVVQEDEKIVPAVPLYRRLTIASDGLKQRISDAGEKIQRTVSSARKRNVLQNRKPVRRKKKDSSRVERMRLQVVVSMAGVHVDVCSTKQKVAQVMTTGLSARLRRYDDRLEVQGVLKDVQLRDVEVNTKYTEMITMESEEMFRVKFTLFEGGGVVVNNMPTLDTSTQLRFGKMKVILLNKFVQKLICYVKDFEDASEAILQAGNVVREKALNVVKEHVQLTKRHEFDILFHAPTLIIPETSNSTTSLVVNLGEVKVENKFTQKDSTPTVVLTTDNIHCSLTNIKVSTAVLDATLDLTSEKDFTEPLELGFQIIRSLTRDYHVVPDYNVEGNLKTITCHIQEDEVNKIVNILNRNYSEGRCDVLLNDVIISKTKRSTKSAIGSLPAALSERRTRRNTDQSEQNIADQRSQVGRLIMKFRFHWESIVLHMHQKVLHSDVVVTDGDICSLCDVIVGELRVVGTISSNDRMNIDVALQTISIDDTRVKSNDDSSANRRILAHSPASILGKPATKVTNNPMFEMTFMKEKDEVVMKIKLCDVLCVLNMEFIMTIARTFRAMVPASDLTTNDTLSSSARSSLSSITNDNSDISSTESNDEEELLSRCELKVSFELSNPQLVVVADVRNVQTHAVFLTLHLTSHYLYLKQMQKLALNMDTISVVTTAFHQQHRTSTCKVISLDAIDVLSSSPIGGKPHINVNTTTVHVDISPLTIHTVNNIINVVQQWEAGGGGRVANKDLGTLWELRDIRGKRLYLDVPPPHVLSAGSSVLVRQTDGTYGRGFLSKKDADFTVILCAGMGEVRHAVGDVTSVILDMLSDERDLVVGVNVLAVYAAVGFKVARICGIWETEGKADERTHNEWEDACADDSQERKYLVRFYHDDVESYLTHEHIRYLPLPLKGVMPGVGAGVLGRYNDGSYYRGVVRGLRGLQIEVSFQDFSEKISHDVDDSAAVIFNMAPQEVQVRELFKVIAKQAHRKVGYHPGKVMLVRGQPGHRTYLIKFEDGSTNEVGVSELRLMPRTAFDTLPSVGAYVYSKISKDSPVYEKGVVTQRGPRLLIDHLNGRKISHAIENISFVVRNIVPLGSFLHVGQDVIAQLGVDDMSMVKGVIKMVILEKRSLSKKYVVEFLDGTERTLTARHIRILSTYGDRQTEDVGSNIAQVRKEQLFIEVEKVSINIQGYMGGSLASLLNFRSKINVQVSDWFTNVKGSLNISLQGKYYNDQVAEWEPLIEPVVKQNHIRDWSVVLDFSRDVCEEHPTSDHGEDSMLLHKPTTSVQLASLDHLNITLTDKSISLLQNLELSFKGDHKCRSSKLCDDISEHCLVVYNRLGETVTIRTNDKKHALEHSTKAEFDTGNGNFPVLSVQVEGYEEIKKVFVKRRRVVLYNLEASDGTQRDSYSIVIDVHVAEGGRFVTIRSPLVFRNKFPFPLQLLCTSKEVDEVIGDVDVDAEYHVPLKHAYHSNIRIKPLCNQSYHNSNQSFHWKTLSNNPRGSETFICERSPGSFMYIHTVFELATYTSTHGLLHDVPRFVATCYPPILLHNHLPYTMQYTCKGGSEPVTLQGGQHSHLFHASTQQRPVIEVFMKDSVGRSWKGVLNVSELRETQSSFGHVVVRSVSGDADLMLGLFQCRENTANVTLYVSYWMVNKTGLDVAYYTTTQQPTHHPSASPSPIAIHMHGKKNNARVSILGYEPSEEFSLDVVGNDTCVKLIGPHGRVFHISIKIKLSKLALTKIVTLTPQRMISNICTHTITLCERGVDESLWHTIEPNSTIPFWSNKPSLELFAIIINGYMSALFNLQPGKPLLLRFQNDVGAICVSYHEKQSSSLITFETYFPGSAPVRLENMCESCMMSYQQVGCATGHVLLYEQSVLYTWDEPTQPQKLQCGRVEDEESTTTVSLHEDGFGVIKAQQQEDVEVYWVSFLDGVQRVVLFTETFKEAYYASSRGQMVRPSWGLDVWVESVGVSLVNTERSCEVAYLSISKSPIVWQHLDKKTPKQMTTQLSQELEEAYNQFKRSNFGRNPSKVKVGDFELDFEQMLITKPEKMTIERVFRSGVELKLCVYTNRVSLSGSVYNLQVDCHVPGCVFPTVIHVVQPAHSVVKDDKHKPFVTFTFIGRFGQRNVINEVTYFKVLVQEIDVRIDRLLLDQLVPFFTSGETNTSEGDRYKADMQHVHRSLESSPEFKVSNQERRFVFTFLHVSPLRIHLSFSNVVSTATNNNNNNTTTAAESSIGGDILSLLLQSVGLVFTEVQDVDFKLACCEITNSLLTSQQLLTQISKHYQTQAVKQLYVLVLGLDVLGNPYELISGAGQGAKNFFYEPYKGFIQGPGEFVDGLRYGVMSLLGGTLGGVSGAVSKITGTVGKGLARLTLDGEYQQLRRQRMSERPSNVGEGLLRGSKGLVKGIVFGVAGIVTKPIQGAKAEGAEGFFKGVGKGEAKFVSVFYTFKSCFYISLVF